MRDAIGRRMVRCHHIRHRRCVSHYAARCLGRDLRAAAPRRAGAFANGAISLVPGALVAAGHPIWTWPAAVLTIFGWLMIAKGAICFLTPEKALRSMAHGASTPRSFVPGGLVLLAMSGWAAWCVWLL